MTVVSGEASSAPEQRPIRCRWLQADLLICFGLALLVRLPALGAWPVWIDEAATVGFAGLPWPDIFGPLLRLETTPPGYYALVKLWAGLFGGSDASLRLLSALAGAAAVVPVVLVCRAAFGPQAAVWGGLLLAVAAPHLHHSREARVYPLLFLAFACGLLFAQRLAASASVPGGRPWGSAAALAAACAIAMVLHHTGAIAAASLFVYAAAVLWAERRLTLVAALPFLAAGCAALAVAAPGLLAAAETARDPSHAASWMPVPGVAETFGTFVLVWFMPVHGTRLLPLELAVPICSLGAVALAAVLYCRFRWSAAHPQAIGLAGALLFSFFAFFGVSQTSPVLLERTVLYSLALFVPLVAAGLAAVGAGWRRLALLAAVFAPQLLALAALHRVPGHGEDWSGLAAYLAREAGAREPFVVLGTFETVALERYLAPEPSARRPLVTVVPEVGRRLQHAAAEAMTRAVPKPAAAAAREICGEVGTASAFWLVARSTVVDLPNHRAAAEALQREGAEPVAKRFFGSLLLERWAVPRCGGGA